MVSAPKVPANSSRESGGGDPEGELLVEGDVAWSRSSVERSFGSQVSRRRAARAWTRSPRSSDGGVEGGRGAGGTGSGTDQCSWSTPPSSSCALSQTVTTRSPVWRTVVES